MQVFGVKKIHRRTGRTADRTRRGRNLRGKRVAAEALESAVEYDIGVHVLQRGEPGFRHVWRRVLRLNALDRLERIQVVFVGHVVGNDQVGEIATANELDPQGIHLLQNGARRKHRAAVRRRTPSLILPETPDRSVNTANRARCRARGNQ